MNRNALAGEHLDAVLELERRQIRDQFHRAELRALQWEPRPCPPRSTDDPRT